MNTISKQIIEILSKNDIDEKDYLNSLSNIYEDIKFSLWKEITIAPNILSFIRSLCFYNFEHKVNCPEHGNCNIQYYGSKYNGSHLFCRKLSFYSLCNDTRIFN